jgi:uncharacterized protein YeaO (DUF488 family)
MSFKVESPWKIQPFIVGVFYILFRVLSEQNFFYNFSCKPINLSLCSKLKLLLMVSIVLKRVYDDFEKEDGFRVLVDRLWPRGVKKESLHCDLWNKDIAPSSELRKWGHQNKDDRWADFAIMYKKQLSNSQAVVDFLLSIKDYNTVTLLTATKSLEQNHAGILKEYIEEKLK